MTGAAVQAYRDEWADLRREELRRERPEPHELDRDVPERDAENACPECSTGVVVEVGRQCRETGHTPLACSDSCGWSS